MKNRSIRNTVINIRNIGVCLDSLIAERRAHINSIKERNRSALRLLVQRVEEGARDLSQHEIDKALREKQGMEMHLWQVNAAIVYYTALFVMHQHHCGNQREGCFFDLYETIHGWIRKIMNGYNPSDSTSEMFTYIWGNDYGLSNRKGMLPLNEDIIPCFSSTREEIMDREISEKLKNILHDVCENAKVDSSRVQELLDGELSIEEFIHQSGSNFTKSQVRKHKQRIRSEFELAGKEKDLFSLKNENRGGKRDQYIIEIVDVSRLLDHLARWNVWVKDKNNHHSEPIQITHREMNIFEAYLRTVCKENSSLGSCLTSPRQIKRWIYANGFSTANGSQKMANTMTKFVQNHLKGVCKTLTLPAYINIDELIRDEQIPDIDTLIVRLQANRRSVI